MAIEIKGTKKEQAVREWFNTHFDGKVPVRAKVIDLFKKFEVDCPGISYGMLNGTKKKIEDEGHVDLEWRPEGGGNISTDSVVPRKPVEVAVTKVDEMDFPDFPLHTCGKEIDLLFSDHEEGGGLYGGTVYVVTGESGVGKSTVLLDHLAAVSDVNPDAKILYLSSEMTKNDIGFYYKKTPAIGKVPTLLLMDYARTGDMDLVLEQTFKEQYDIILVDSFQDIVVKLKEIMGWRSTYAESWMINKMIECSENLGTAILAIQHLTKGGTYVGSTYLKHATQGMINLRFDETGKRYVEFEKNRRGGGETGKRLYFNLVNEEIVYDIQRFEETAELAEVAEEELVNRKDLNSKFESVFMAKNEDVEEDEYADAQEADDSVVAEVIENPEGEDA